MNDACLRSVFTGNIVIFLIQIHTETTFGGNELFVQTVLQRVPKLDNQKYVPLACMLIMAVYFLHLAFS